MQTLIDVVGVPGCDGAPQRNLGEDTLTDYEQKEPELKPRLATSPTPPVTQARNHGSASGSRPDCPPINATLRLDLERLLTNEPQASCEQIDELLIAAPLSQTSPRLRHRLRPIGPQRAAVR